MLAPIDRRAFGAALGTVCGLGVLLLTLVHLAIPAVHGLPLELLSQYWPGYRLSWAGALAGFAWAFAVGFVAGWFTALVRNLVVVGWLLLTRGRHELAATRDFLDRI
jgi:hypothetical protein